MNELETELLKFSNQLMQQLDEEFIQSLRDKLAEQTEYQIEPMFVKFQVDYIVALLLMIIYLLKNEQKQSGEINEN